MEQDRKKESGPGEMFTDWAKSTNEFMETWMKMWGQAAEKAQAGLSGGQEAPADSGEAFLDYWRAWFSKVSETALIEPILKAMSSYPDVLFQMARQGGEKSAEQYAEWLRQMTAMPSESVPWAFREEALKGPMDQFRKEMEKYFQMPQVGLTRFYQERMNRVAITFNNFMAATVEMMALFLKPFQKAFLELQAQLIEQAKGGQISSDPREHYRNWIKILEKHFADLSTAPEYIESVSNMLNAMGDFMMARQEMLMDMMKALPVPSNRDFDDVSRELYETKRRARDLEARLAKLETSAGDAEELAKEVKSLKKASQEMKKQIKKFDDTAKELKALSAEVKALKAASAKKEAQS